MSYEHEPISPMFRIDVSADGESESGQGQQVDSNDTAVDLLKELVAGQKQQNRLLEELVHQQVAANKQRAIELQQWKNANPELANSCRQAAETLSRVQTQFLDTLTEEIADSEEHLVEGDVLVRTSIFLIPLGDVECREQRRGTRPTARGSVGTAAAAGGTGKQHR